MPPTKAIAKADEDDFISAYDLTTWLQPDEQRLLSDEPVDEAIAAQQSVEIAGRILAAKSKEEAFAPSQVIHARDILQTPLAISGFKLFRSSFDKGSPVFAVMDATDISTGEIVKISCSAVNVLFGLLKARRENWFPLDVRIVESANPTAAGFHPLSFELLTGE